MSSGPQWATIPWLSLVLPVTSTVTESRYGVTVRRHVRHALRKTAEINPIGCLRVSGENADVHLPLKLYCTDSHVHTHACNCLHTGVLFYSVDGQHFHTLKFQSESKPDIFVPSDIFIKCFSSRLYFVLHIWHHEKKLAFLKMLQYYTKNLFFTQSLLIWHFFPHSS